MSLLSAIEAVGKGILCFFALFVGVVLRAALVAEAYFDGGAV